jgi:hypothetical protein
MSGTIEFTDTVPTPVEEQFPPNTYTEPAIEDPIFISSQTIEGSTSIPEDPTTNKLAIYYTEIVPIPFTELEGFNDSNIPTDDSGIIVPPVTSITSISNTNNYTFEGGDLVNIIGINLGIIAYIRIQNTQLSFVVNSSISVDFTTPICPDNDHTTFKTIDFYDIYNTLITSIPITYNPPVSVFGISSVDINTSTLLGNVIITITGSAFFFVSRVIVCNTDVLQFEIVNSTTIRAVTAPFKYNNVPFLGDIQIIDYNGNQVVLTNSFTYTNPPPFLLGLSVNKGPITGGTLITIVGAYLDQIVSVTLGGIPVVWNIINSTTLTILTNSGVFTGIPLDLVLNSTTFHEQFTYEPPVGIPVPIVRYTSFDRGFVSGGYDMVITGNNLTNTTSVVLGGNSLVYTIDSDTQITCTIPVGIYTGLYEDLTINTTFGSYTKLRAFLYIYPTPTLVSSSVNTGSMIGGTTIVLTGTNFYLISDVVVCGVEVQSFVINSPTQITCITRSAIGVADTLGNIQVVGTFGTATLFNSFTYFSVQTPVITFMSPTYGLTTGGTQIIFTGTNFTSVSSITFDGVPVISFTIDSNIQITCVAPVGVYTGNYANVLITNSFGSQSVSNIFSYVFPPPIVSSISPSSGSVSGGNSLIITGNYFTGTSSVFIGTNPAVSYVVNSNTQITATTPGEIYTNTARNITVTTGQGTNTLSSAFLYLPNPVVLTVTPSTRNISGGGSIVITGLYFNNTSDVQLGTTSVTSFTIDSTTQITAIVPTGSFSGVPLDVNVITPQGTGTLTNGFTYYPTPTLISISPNTITTSGGNTCILTGTNFVNVSSVKIGITPVTSYTVDSNTQITCVTPPGSVGPTTITVETSHGNVTSSSGFISYLATPTLTSCTPSSGILSGGTSCVLVGTNFVNVSSVKVGTTPVTSYTVDSITQITCITPSGSVGPTTITIETSHGNVTSSSGFFTYTSPIPTITSVSPTSGTMNGGTSIVITGTNFTGASSVKINGYSFTSYTVDSNTQITATTPVGASTSAQTISVTNPDGTGTSATGLYTFTRISNTNKILDRVSSTTRSSMFGIYQTRLVSSSYTGAIFRIRRSTDNVESDVYSDDSKNYTISDQITTLVSWLSGATAYITTWYDQSTNTNNATQTNTSLQPILNVANGFIDTRTNRYMNLPNGVFPTVNSEYTVTIKHGTTDTTSNAYYLACGPNGTNDSNIFSRNLTTYQNIWGSNDISFGTYSNGNVFTVKYDQSNRRQFVNKIVQTPSASSSHNQTNTNNTIGGTNSGNYANTDLYFIYISNISIPTLEHRILEEDDTSGYSRYFSGTDISSTSPFNASLATSYYNSVKYVFGANLFIVIDGKTNIAQPIVTSSDAITWTKRSATAVGSNDSMLDIQDTRVETPSSVNILTSGLNNTIRKSTDGITWSLPGGASGYKLAYISNSTIPSRWISVDGTTAYYSNNQGTTWTSVAVTNVYAACTILGALNVFILFPFNHTTLRTSSDGITYTPSTIPIVSDRYLAITYANEIATVMTIGADQGNVYTTTNGTTWTLKATLGAGIIGITWARDLYMWVALGSTGIQISTDGSVWTLVNSKVFSTASTYGRWDYSGVIRKGVACMGNTVYTTDDSKRGSLDFTSNGNLSLTNSLDFRVGTGDFCIEWYHYQTSATSGTTPYIFSLGQDFAFSFDSTTKEVKIYMNTIVVFTGAFELLNQWVHIAITRSSSSLRIFRDGYQIGSTITDSTNITNSTDVLRIGNTSTTSSSNQFVGYLTNFHWIKGTAVYTSNFTPNTLELTKTTNSKILITCPSTNISKDYAQGLTVTNNGCVYSSKTPFA